MTDITIKKDDLLPVFKATLLEGTSSVDLSTGTDSINFYMRNKITGELKITAGSMNFNTDGSDGIVEYTWASGNTNTVSDYEAEIIVTWTADSKEQTFPNDKNITLSIIEDVE